MFAGSAIKDPLGTIILKQNNEVISHLLRHYNTMKVIALTPYESKTNVSNRMEEVFFDCVTAHVASTQSNVLDDRFTPVLSKSEKAFRSYILSYVKGLSGLRKRSAIASKVWQLLQSFGLNVNTGAYATTFGSDHAASVAVNLYV